MAICVLFLSISSKFGRATRAFAYIFTVRCAALTILLGLYVVCQMVFDFFYLYGNRCFVCFWFDFDLFG